MPFALSLLINALIIAALCMMSVSGCSSEKKEEIIPMEFLVVTEENAADVLSEEPNDVREEEPEPKSEPKSAKSEPLPPPPPPVQEPDSLPPPPPIEEQKPTETPKQETKKPEPQKPKETSKEKPKAKPVVDANAGADLFVALPCASYMITECESSSAIVDAKQNLVRRMSAFDYEHQAF